MANSWLRLWHDMPNDPKWRTIARASKQPIATVLAVYVHLLVIASNATERGRTQNVCSEDIASALDVETEQIDLILAAMQGRVLDGDMVSGWAKRQVEREDGAAERAKRWREAQKEAKQTQPNAYERKQTPDKDKDKDKEKNTGESAKRATRKCPADFLVTDSMTEWALTECPGVPIEAATRKFRDHTFKTAMTDWPATWRNWIRSDFERLPKATSGETAYQRSMREKMERDFPNLTNIGVDHGAAIALG